ncbi:PREDICTED: zinc finger protein ZAT5-like [Ipomoea nil]|uniref:zinc finger protein ZAT5-like n=1 Tax=Ipomoea nil TaxID=35883 RepID=UPI000901D8A8|nr:PREDICTED: zinc finger protein ZAT5-like [Ipomoea nil]
MEGFEVGKRDESICPMKKRRTKRPRHHDTSSSLSSFSDNSGGFDHRRSLSNDSDIELNHHRVEEEEDMAKCLMLLSQGHIRKPPPSAAAAAAAGMNREVYECKTCNRVFPSFQALGGHRASHRKPKAAAAEQQQQNQESVVVDDDVTTLSLQIPGRPPAVTSSPPRNKVSNRIHECSICGAEFSSGQALGGHMRRHRPLPSIAAADQEIKKPSLRLALDLNLPAPEDDHREITKFPFASKEQVIVFSASPLVDCHY